MTRTPLRAWLLLAALGTLLLPLSVAQAGPNAGGVLVVHDAGLKYAHTNAEVPICAQGSAPAGISTVDARVDGATTADSAAVFRIYAVFPTASSPRLQGVTFGIHYDPSLLTWASGGSYGKCGDFELPDAGWPDNGTGATVTWPAAQTSHVVPVYWFAAYMNNEGPVTPSLFELGPQPTQGGYFGDDSEPLHRLDFIAGYGKIGFGMNGAVPPEGGTAGACCDPQTEICTFVVAADCPEGAVFKGPDVPCDATVCRVVGGCCYPDDHCANGVLRTACLNDGGKFQEQGCASSTCQFSPLRACCRGTICALTREVDCADGMWRVEVTNCDPNPCVEGMGACCIEYAGVMSCLIIVAADDCVGIFHAGEGCPVAACPPGLGACCQPGGSCAVTTQAECSGAGDTWRVGVDCYPQDYCQTPAERTSWGRLKSLYHD